MGCSFYTDYTNKMTINGFFLASLRNNAFPLLSRHGKQQYSTTILFVINFLFEEFSIENSLNFVSVVEL